MNSKIAGNNASSLHSKIGRPTVKNYADGGEVSDGEWARSENYGDGTTGDERVAMARDPEYQEPVKVEAVPESKVESTPIKQSFKEAFAENRKAGNSTFEWNGKKFTTEVATGKAAPRMEAKRPATDSTGKTFAQDMAERKGANTVEKRVSDAMTRNENYGNEGRRPVMAKPATSGRGVIDTSNIDSKTLLPKR